MTVGGNLGVSAFLGANPWSGIQHIFRQQLLGGENFAKRFPDGRLAVSLGTGGGNQQGTAGFHPFEGVLQRFLHLVDVDIFGKATRGSNHHIRQLRDRVAVYLIDKTTSGAVNFALIAQAATYGAKTAADYYGAKITSPNLPVQKTELSFTPQETEILLETIKKRNFQIQAANLNSLNKDTRSI